MGTDYGLGIVKEFTAASYKSLSQEEWMGLLNEKFDLDMYTIQFDKKEASGKIKEGLFQENIEDFYMKLAEVLGDDFILNWYKDKGTDLEQYDNWISEMRFNQSGIQINLTARIAILFVEGKVIVETFSYEPILMNWLFRHVDLSNKLSGCVISDIIG